MSEPFLGEIRLFPYTFAPRNWAFCAGQIMAISQNQALFALLGTNYGGNGVTTFGLPDLRGRVAMSSGQSAASGTLYNVGQVAGSETVTLISTQMPMHNHTIAVATEDADQKNPTGQVLAAPGAPAYAAPSNINANLAPQAVGMAGGSQPHPNMQPYQVLNYCIAMVGIFPSRN
jgi:microcystin-dependent protein